MRTAKQKLSLKDLYPRPRYIKSDQEWYRYLGEREVQRYTQERMAQKAKKRNWWPW